MSVLLKVMRKLSSAFREKPTIEPDHFELEHFLLYHGLVGSSPENQRKFRDVKADISLAIENESSAHLGIALKLLPLWWEDKLKNIIDEVDKDKAIRVLAPDRSDDDSTNNDYPLFHESWKVRANAAMLIAYLKAEQKVDQLVACLSNTRENTKMATCHVLHALGNLGASAGLPAIADFLFDQDPWLRVDAAYAYALLSKNPEDSYLTDAILSPHLLSDYSAVQVSKHIAVERFLISKNEASRLAGFRLISGICHAARQTFPNEIVFDREIDNLATEYPETFKAMDSPIQARAACDLKNWLLANNRANHADLIEELLQEGSYFKSLDSFLEESDFQEISNQDKSQIASAIYLIGELNLKDRSSYLVKNLKSENPFLEDILEALAKIEATEGADEELVGLAKQLVDLSERTGQTLSAKPVMEENEKDTKTYYRVLKALGKQSTQKSLDYLLLAANDFAPDKRNQAIKSLTEIAVAKPEFQDSIARTIVEALADNSLEVKQTATLACGELGLKDGCNKIIEIALAKEVSLSNQALKTLSDLAKNGHRDFIVENLQSKLKSVRNQYQQEKLNKLLENIEKHAHDAANTP